MQKNVASLLYFGAGTTMELWKRQLYSDMTYSFWGVGVSWDDWVDLTWELWGFTTICSTMAGKKKASSFMRKLYF